VGQRTGFEVTADDPKTLAAAIARIEKLRDDREHLMMVITAVYSAQKVAERYGKPGGSTGLPDGAGRRGVYEVMRRFFPSMMTAEDREAGYWGVKPKKDQTASKGEPDETRESQGGSVLTPKPGQVYARPDGSRVRVDDVKGGQVYYVAWRPGQDVGNPFRMIVTDFEIAIRKESMVPCETYRCVSCGGRFLLEETHHACSPALEQAGYAIESGPRGPTTSIADAVEDITAKNTRLRADNQRMRDGLDDVIDHRYDDATEAEVRSVKYLQRTIVEMRGIAKNALAPPPAGGQDDGALDGLIETPAQKKMLEAERERIRKAWPNDPDNDKGEK
jgi:hypothetical protein